MAGLKINRKLVVGLNIKNCQLFSERGHAMDNEEIIKLIGAISKKNDQVAFGQVYRHFFPGLLSFANSIIRDRHLSEEVVENVFVKLWENRLTLDTVRNVSHYIYVAVKHASLNCVYRHKKINYAEIGDDFTLSYKPVENGIIENENLQKIDAAINSLPPKCKLIFRLVKEERMKYDEVAQLLEVSPKTVETQLLIALRKISDTLRVALPEFKSYYRSKKSS